MFYVELEPQFIWKGGGEENGTGGDWGLLNPALAQTWSLFPSAQRFYHPASLMSEFSVYQESADRTAVSNKRIGN